MADEKGRPAPVMNCIKHERMGLLVDILSQDSDAPEHSGERMRYGLERARQLGFVDAQVTADLNVAYAMTHDGDLAVSLVITAIKQGWCSEHLGAYLDRIQFQ